MVEDRKGSELETKVIEDVGEDKNEDEEVHKNGSNKQITVEWGSKSGGGGGLIDKRKYKKFDEI